MKDLKINKTDKQNGKELLFSELLIAIMQNNKSVRQLAKEAKLSSSVIQDIRAGKQHNMKVSNLIKIAQVLGYELILQKEDQRFSLQEETKNGTGYLSVITNINFEKNIK